MNTADCHWKKIMKSKVEGRKSKEQKTKNKKQKNNNKEQSNLALDFRPWTFDKFLNI